jgi:arylsulfatase A-like enzyme
VHTISLVGKQTGKYLEVTIRRTFVVLSILEKKLFIRQADVFAAYVAYTDHEIGRVIQAVEDIGKLDNTLIIYISGDNGTSAEGSILGTPIDMAAIQGVNIPVTEQLKFYDVGVRTRPLRTWLWAGPGHSIRRSNGPSKWHPTSGAPGRA